MTADSAARVRFVEFEPAVDDPLTTLLRTWGVTLDVDETLVWARHRAATLLVGDVDPHLLALLVAAPPPITSARELPPPPVHGVTARTIEVTPPSAPAIPLSSRRGRFSGPSDAPPQRPVAVEPPRATTPTVELAPPPEAMAEPVPSEASADDDELHELDADLLECVDEPPPPGTNTIATPTEPSRVEPPKLVEPPSAPIAAARAFIDAPRTTLASPTTPHPLVDAAPPAPAPARRRQDRFSSAHPVLLRYESWDDFATVYTQQISVGGMFVPVDDPPPFGSRVTVRLALPEDSGQIRLDGEVVHAISGDVAAATGQTAGFGLQLDPMSDETKSQLAKVVAHAERGHGEQVQRALHGLHASGKRTSTSLRITLTDLEATTMAELRRELIAAKDRSDVEVLGLADGYTQAAVREAFHRLASRWHPSASARFATEDAKRMAMEIFMRIEQAYQRLSLTGASTQPPTPASQPSEPESLLDLPDAPNSAPPRRLSQSARTALRARLQHPLVPNEPTARGEPETAERRGGDPLGDASALIRDKRYDEAIALLKVALTRRPHAKTQVLLYFAEARKLVADKNLPEARQKYEALLALDPTHKVAQRDLVMLQCLG